ncbi:hypothetical protein ACISK3_13655 [Morganella morganii]
MQQEKMSAGYCKYISVFRVERKKTICLLKKMEKTKSSRYKGQISPFFNNQDINQYKNRSPVLYLKHFIFSTGAPAAIMSIIKKSPVTLLLNSNHTLSASNIINKTNFNKNQSDIILYETNKNNGIILKLYTASTGKQKWNNI